MGGKRRRGGCTVADQVPACGNLNLKWSTFYTYSRPGSVVGIETGYGLDGLGNESRWGRDFPHLSRPVLGATQPPSKWVPGFFQG
jgi:hypothetical protein